MKLVGGNDQQLLGGKDFQISFDLPIVAAGVDQNWILLDRFAKCCPGCVMTGEVSMLIVADGSLDGVANEVNQLWIVEVVVQSLWSVAEVRLLGVCLLYTSPSPRDS